MPEIPRVGLGFDVHAREDGRPMWLGGLRFEGVDGLAGHSDGDAVCHALADALFGAASLGDVGEHFPDTEPAVAGIPGSELLGRSAALVRQAGFEVASCDVTVICENPPVAPRRDEMRSALAAALGIDAGAISVKATRPEGLWLAGDGAGCLAVAVLT